MSAGGLFYERGPGRTVAALATVFQHLAARGALQADDPQTAAEHFNWLVMSTPVNQVMLCGDTELPERASLSHYADAGTRAFLAAYGPN